MTEAPRFADILVVGAGAAGLACARELLRAGRDVLVVEVKSVIGGRLHSVHAPASSQPLELGAEFVHGASASTLADLQGFAFFDVLDRHLLRESGKLKRVDYFAKLEDMMKAVQKLKGDHTVAEYAAKLRSKENRNIFVSFVEGFHAADTQVMGTRALAKAGGGEEEELNGASMFRLDGPYVGILQNWVPPDKILFNTRVREIAWRKDHVSLRCTGPAGDFELRGQKAVITLPIGVLKALPEQGGVAWDPVPETLPRILGGVEMGHVQKLILGFKTRFWEKLSEEEPVSFLHTGPSRYFPTWWTQAPMRTRYLTAWQGGPKANEMSTWTPEERIAAALKTLAEITKKSPPWLKAQMETAVSHNWSLDTAAFGAYSYVRKDAIAAAKLYTQPIDDTIYFAGEAGALDSGRGTVHGAIHSGITAARNCLA